MTWPVIWTRLNPNYPRMLFVKYGWNWPRGSCEDFKNFANVYLVFRNYLPLENGGTLHLNKFEFRSLKNALSQVWLKLAQWFWRRFLIFKFRQFLLFRNYPPLKRALPVICTKLIYIPFIQGYIVPSLVEIGSVVLEKKKKSWKVYIQTDRRTTGDQKSTLELSAPVS